jgi:hypothetical protein
LTVRAQTPCTFPGLLTITNYITETLRKHHWVFLH